MTQISARFNSEENENHTTDKLLATEAGDRANSSPLQKFYNLSITRKTGLIPWFSVIALALILGVQGLILRNTLKSQLLREVKSQLAVTDLVYNLKIDRMSTSFRGQTDNETIIAAVSQTQITPDLRRQATDILRNEVMAQDIEYATLVGKDKKIIASATTEAIERVFVPIGLVSQVLQNPLSQLQASELVPWQELAIEKPPLVPPESDSEYALVRYTLTPILNGSDEVEGVLVSGDLVDGMSIVERAAAAFTGGLDYSAIYLRQPTAGFALATSILEVESKTPRQFVPLSDEKILQQAVDRLGETVTRFSQIDGKTYALAAKAIPNREGEAIGVILFGRFADSSIFWRSMTAQIVLGAIITIAIYCLSQILARAIAQPLQKLQLVAQEFASGNAEVRALVNTTDEVGLLARTFNVMADAIENNNRQLREDARRSRILKEIALEISQATEVERLLQIAVKRSRDLVRSDRTIYYRLDPDWQGTIVAESVAKNLPQALGTELEDFYLTVDTLQLYLQGQVKVIPDIYNSGANERQLQILESLEVKASAIAPVIVGEKLVGLFIAHQCDRPRRWQETDIESLAQIASQVGNALARVELLERQQSREAREREARENLQRRALELLMEVDPVSQGDLSIRVNVGEDEIGTIADSYNATIESLRELVVRVQSAAGLVSTTTSEKNISLQQLSAYASEQTTEITAALKRIRGIANSIKAVAENATAAEQEARRAAATVKAGDDAMNRTVTGFQEIRTTVAATAKKVKRLGESSQKISKVVNVISNFADQTNLLALNASIEAAHAGEEGRGFAVVAEEVRSLARQSAEATEEIVTLVAEIQAETKEVVAAMESGTEQVVTGTKLVDETRLSLNQIAEVSAKIDRLVNAIAQATVEQSQDSEAVSQAMSQVAAIFDKTATEASEVSASFKELLTVAQQLQDSVAKFKV